MSLTAEDKEAEADEMRQVKDRPLKKCKAQEQFYMLQ